MKRSPLTHPFRLLPMLAALAFPLTGLALPQDAGLILLEEGDILSNGMEVSSIGDEIAMDSFGRWIALVTTVGTTSENDTAVVADGQVIVAESDVLPDGSTLRFLRGLDLDRDGTSALLYRTELPGSGLQERRFQLGPNVIFRQDDPISSPALPPGSTYYNFTAVDLALPYALLVGEVRDAALVRKDVALLLDFTAGGTSSPPEVTVIAVEGATPPALPGPIAALLDSGEVTRDGDYVLPIACSVGGATHYALRSNTGWVVLPGAPSPVAGANWLAQSKIEARISRSGRRALTGEIDVAGGIRGLLVSQPGGVVVQESEPFALTPGLSAGPNSRLPAALSETGELAYVANIETIGDILVYGNELYLREGTSTISGQVVTGILPVLSNLELGRDGEAILLTCMHAGSDSSLVLVERSIGSTSSCAATANSTGNVGRLGGQGSSYLSVNDVRINARDLPANAFGYLLVSETESFVAMPGGSAGNLCLGGEIGRFIGQVQSSGPQGRIQTVVDLTAIPQPNGSVTATANETWAFQLWHRDSSPAGQPSSNFTESLVINVR